MSYETTSADYCPKDRYSSAEQMQSGIQKGINMGQYAHNRAEKQAYAYGGAILGATAQQRPQGSVAREIQQLEKNLHLLAGVIDSLDNRLASVFVPSPETSSGLRSSDGGGCALANQIAGFNSMLSSQISRIEMIHQGVDL
jgi:hypothetical protein